MMISNKSYSKNLTSCRTIPNAFQLYNDRVSTIFNKIRVKSEEQTYEFSSKLNNH